MKIRKFRGEIGAVLTVRGFPKEVVKRIVARATFTNPAYDAVNKYGDNRWTNIPEKLSFAWDYKRELTCSRGILSMLPNELLKYFQLVNWEDHRTWKTVSFPEMRRGLSWNEEQQQCMQVVEDALQNKRRRFGNYLVVASTSVGKTILQASIAARLSQRTLVLCPTDLIMRAWREDLQKAFNFTSKDLGLIKQKKWIVGDCITLASIQTLGRRRESWQYLNDEIGTVIVDEVQGCSAPTVYEFLSQCPAAYLVGATATIESRDGGTNLHLRSLFGKPIVQVHTYHKETASSLRISEVKLVNTNFRYEYQSDNLDWNDLSNHLTGNEERNQLIINNAKKDWLAKKVVLVVTKRVEHVELLYSMAQEAGITNVNKLTGGTNTNKFYTDKLMKLLASRKITFLVATMQAIKIGANIPVLDSLHLAMMPANQRDLEQLFGRIRRKAKGKEEAVITYYYDRYVGYMAHLFKKIAVPVFRKLKLPGWENVYVS